MYHQRFDLHVSDHLDKKNFKMPKVSLISASQDDSRNWPKVLPTLNYLSPHICAKRSPSLGHIHPVTSRPYLTATNFHQSCPCSLLNLHNHFLCNASFKWDKDFIPRPPHFLGCIIDSQLEGDTYRPHYLFTKILLEWPSASSPQPYAKEKVRWDVPGDWSTLPLLVQVFYHWKHMLKST